MLPYLMDDPPSKVHKWAGPYKHRMRRASESEGLARSPYKHVMSYYMVICLASLCG